MPGVLHAPGRIGAAPPRQSRALPWYRQALWANAVQRIVVHCDAGISRSPAVAAALARTLGADESEFFTGKYRPNMRVYRLLMESAPDAAR